MNRNLLKLVFTGFFAAAGASAWAQTPQTIVSTFGNYGGGAFGMVSGQAFGQTINLSESDFSLTGFEFEYFTPTSYLSTLVGVNLAFYANTGPNGSPAATPFYNSGFVYNNNPPGTIPVSQIGEDLAYTTTDFTGGDGPGAIVLPANFLMPTTFTVSIEFTNVDTAGGPTVNGQIALPSATNNNTYASTVANEYWVNSGGVWTPYTNAIGNNVLFSFTGVPEPTMLGLGGLGGLLLLGATKLKRK